MASALLAGLVPAGDLLPKIIHFDSLGLGSVAFEDFV